MDTSYPDLVWRLVILAAGMGLVMAPATDSVMGSLPLAKAGVGSAVNDTTRQVGGALGVAIVGSVVSSVYGSQVGDFFAGKPAPPAAVDAAKNSLGGAYAVAHNLGEQSIPGAKALAASLQSAANTAFVDAFHWGAIVGGAVLVLAVAIVVAYLPARATAVEGGRPTPGDTGVGRTGTVTGTGTGACTAVPRRAASCPAVTAGRGPRRGRADVTAAPVRAGRPRSAEADDAILDSCARPVLRVRVRRAVGRAGRGGRRRGQDDDLPPVPDEARPGDGGAGAGQGGRAGAGGVGFARGPTSSTWRGATSPCSRARRSGGRSR